MNRGYALVVAIFGLLLVPHSALAQGTAADRAAAEALFDEAVKLLDAGNPGAACPKLEESERLDPGVGTLLYLADCYSQVGRTASAWATFRDAAYAAHTAGQSDREQTATQSAAALEPTLSFIVLNVAAADTADLQIKRDGEVVGKALWTSPVPMDPGSHQLEVTAPGKKPWKTQFDVPKQAGTVTIAVPALQDAPAAPVAANQSQGPGSQPQDQANVGSTQRTFGWVAMGVGVGTLGAAGLFSLLAVKDDNAANDHCLPNNPLRCDSQGVQLGDRALRRSNVATVLTGVGAVVGVGGLVLVLTAPSGSSHSALNVSAQVGELNSVSVNGVW
jgi:serine/threonine-protein kinase